MGSKEHNKLVIFDLDGVLIESRDFHYVALNQALEKLGYLPITLQDHLSRFDGLPTTQKLSLLNKSYGINPIDNDSIWEEKQKATRAIFCDIGASPALQFLFLGIKEKGCRIAVASNSIRETLKIALLKLGILEFVDYYISNEDVKNPKPSPEMYFKCMVLLGAIPDTTLIIEDSHIGREAALNTKAHLYAVENATSWEPNELLAEIDNLFFPKTLSPNIIRVPWKDSKLTVVIPMAGAGSRFAEAGYTFPKPLIEVKGKPMIQVVVENLNIDANYVFIVQKSHYEKYNLNYMLPLIVPEGRRCEIVQLDGISQGAAVTVLSASHFYDNEKPLIIANSDQFIQWNSNEVMYAFQAGGIDAGIPTFKSTHPKWSFCRLDDIGFVVEVAEKKPISDHATVGIYYWKQGKDFVKYAAKMMQNDANRVNNEWYVCPVFNQAIADGKRIRIKEIEQMWGLGTPEDLNYFLANYKGLV